MFDMWSDFIKQLDVRNGLDENATFNSYKLDIHFYEPHMPKFSKQGFTV